MDHLNRQSLERESEIPLKLTPSPRKTSTHESSGAYPCARENNAGDSIEATNNTSHRIEELEKLISRLNNAMLTLEEENLKLHKRLKMNKPEMSAQATPDDHGSNTFRDNGAFSSEKTDRDGSNTSLLQEAYTQVKIENNSLKKKLKEAEKCCKQCSRELQKLLQKYEDLKAQNETLEQYNKQLVMDNSTFQEKLNSLRGQTIRVKTMESLQDSENSLTGAQKADARIGRQTGHDHGRLSFKEKQTNASSCISNFTTDGAHHSQQLADRCLACVGKEQEAVSETVARLKEELRESTERGAQAEESARRLREEHAILEACLKTVQQEKDLLRVEVRELHQDYINLSDSITLQLKDKASGQDRAPEAHSSVCPTHNHPPASTQSNSNSTELKENPTGACRSIGPVYKKAPAMRRSTSSDSITLQPKDKVTAARRSAGSTPDKASADCKRTSREDIKLSTTGNPTQIVKHGPIDKDTIERIRIRYEEDELKRAQRLISNHQ